jgi:hypothetical protein
LTLPLFLEIKANADEVEKNFIENYASLKKILVSVDGGIQPETIDGFLKKVQPDKFNTRLVTFYVLPGQECSQAVSEALRFEILMLEHDAKQGFISRDEEKIRVKELKKNA